MVKKAKQRSDDKSEGKLSEEYGHNRKQHYKSIKLIRGTGNEGLVKVRNRDGREIEEVEEFIL